MRTVTISTSSFLAGLLFFFMLLGAVLAVAAIPWTISGAKGGQPPTGKLISRWLVLIKPAAQRWGVPVALVEAVMEQESGGNPMAVRADSNGSVDAGLMQINSSNWSAYGLGENPFDPTRNIRAGVQMLADDLHRYGEVSLALAAYNAGPQAVVQWHGVPPYAASYVQHVLQYYQDFLHGNS